jgi:uncharacterized integral membrane protein
MVISLILFITVTILAVFFSSFNQTMVDVNFFGYPVQGTIGLMMVLALGIGVIIGVLIMLPSVASRNWALFRHKKKIEELEEKPARKSTKKK